ncbi:MAG: hypothetical protein ACREJJ_05445 [Candidatus Methylomirabilales bacterium]
MNNINHGVAAYARSFGNSEKRLDEWCKKFETFDLRDEIISLVRKIEDEIMRDILNGDKSYEGKELEIMVTIACNACDARIEKEGMAAILDYVAWMCWHEGYLK